MDQCTSLALYDLGLNVTVQPYGKKEDLPWRCLFSTRLLREDLADLFQFPVNPAVLVGRTSRNLFVIDCETGEAFDRLRHDLIRRGIRFWSVKTARGGHIWLFCKDGEVANIRSGKTPDIEVRGARLYVLIPGAVHPSGVIYEWLDYDGGELPEVQLSQLDNLLPIPLKLAKGQYAGGSLYEDSGPTLRNLSRNNRDYLENGVPEGQRHNRQFAAICDLVGCGFDDFEIEKQARSAAAKCTPPLPSADVEAAIKEAYSKPRTPARPQAKRPRLDRNPAYKHVRAWVYAQTWTGQSAATDREVCLALCERARTANANGVFRASEREIAVIARVGPATVHRATARLIKRGILIDVSPQKRNAPREFRFNAEIYVDGSMDRCLGDISDPSMSFSVSDLAERNALGKTAVAVLQHLVSYGPSTAREIEARGLFTRRTICAACKKLAAVNLVTNTEKLFSAIPITADELQHLAEHYGVAGKGQERAERFQHERAVYAFKTISSALGKHLREKEKSDKTGVQDVFISLSHPEKDTRDTFSACATIPNRAEKLQFTIPDIETLVRQFIAIRHDLSARRTFLDSITIEQRGELRAHLYGVAA